MTDNVVALNSDDESERHEAFANVAARYQYLQREITKPGPEDARQSDNHFDNLMDQKDGALWDVIRTHAVSPYQVDFKLQVLRELLEIGLIGGQEFFLLESIRQT
jgi:hypothetical protein